MSRIGPESSVELYFEIRLLDATIIDSNFGKQPAQFKIGDGNMLAGFESVLMGLTAGTQQTFELLPEQAFGMPNPSNIQVVARSKFSDMQLEQGLVISFQDPSGELPGVVAEFDETEVSVDFNHPLAGKTLVFQVEILNVF